MNERLPWVKNSFPLIDLKNEKGNGIKWFNKNYTKELPRMVFIVHTKQTKNG